MASPERSRGDDWAEGLKAAGCWVQKLPASSMSGLPDWLVGRLGGLHPRFVEAKAALDGGVVYRPNQVTNAQRFFLDRWVESGGRASILILAEDGWVEIEVDRAHLPLTRVQFDAIKWNYYIGEES